jgi:hypothetical protein
VAFEEDAVAGRDVPGGAEVAGAEGLAAVEYMEDRIRPIPCTMGFMVLGVLSIVGAVVSLYIWGIRIGYMVFAQGTEDIDIYKLVLTHSITRASKFLAECGFKFTPSHNIYYEQLKYDLVSHLTSMDTLSKEVIHGVLEHLHRCIRCALEWSFGAGRPKRPPTGSPKYLVRKLVKLVLLFLVDPF